MPKAKRKLTANGRGGPQVLSRFGPYLTKRRLEMKWSLRKLAKMAKTAHSNVFQWEQLKKDPRLTELDALARAFGEPLLTFMGGVAAPSDREEAKQS